MPVPATPGAPTVTLAAAPSRTVTISWATVSGATSYSVLRTAPSVTVIASDLTGLSTTDTAASDGTWTYAVTATNDTGSSTGASASVNVDRTAPTGTPGFYDAQQLSISSRTVTLTSNTSPTSVTGDLNAQFAVFRDGVDTGARITSGSTTTTETPTTNGSYTYTLRVIDQFGNLGATSSSKIVPVAIMGAPATPTITIANSPSRVVTVSWSNVTGGDTYRISFSNNTVAPRTSTFIEGVTSPTTFTAANDGLYQLAVVAVNTASGKEVYGPFGSITVDRTAPATAPTITTVTQWALSQRYVDVNFSSSPTVSGGAGAVYRIYRDGVYTGTTTATTTAQDQTLTTDGTFAYTATVMDAAGNESAVSNSVNVTIHRWTTPSVPAAPTVTIAASPSRVLTITWPAVTNTSTPPAGDNSATYYYLHRDNVFVTSVSATTKTYTEAVDGSHTYQIQSFNPQASSAKSTATTFVTDRTAPGAVTGLTATLAASPSRSVTVSWTAATGTPSGYNVERRDASDVLIATLASNQAGTSYVETNVPDGTYNYWVYAVDAAGNVGTGTSVALSVDRTATAAPTISSIALNALGSRVVNVTMSIEAAYFPGGSSDGYYKLYRNGTFVATLGDAVSRIITDTAPADGTYTYAVSYVDSASGNRLNESAQTSQSFTVDTVAPNAPVLSSAVQASPPTTRTVTITMANAPATYGGTLFRIYRDGTAVGSFTGTSGTDTPSVDGSYVYTVKAEDAAGNKSGSSASATVNVLLVPLPAQPAAPTLVVSPYPSRSITVSWTAVAGATSYTVTRTGTSSATYSGQTGSSFLDNGPNVDGSYTYTVTAANTSGSSTPSPSTSVTVDRTSPSVPGTVIATLAAVPSRTVTISWGAATGGAVKYTVKRVYSSNINVTDATLPDVVGGTSTTESNVPDGDWKYSVIAVDAADNPSAATLSATLTVDRTAPSTPSIVQTGTVYTSAASYVINFSATASSAGGTGAAYKLYVDGVYHSTRATAATSYTVVFSGEESHTYYITNLDAAGNESAPSNVLTVVHDTVAPNVPTNVTAVQEIPQARQVKIDWTAVPGAVQYEVYRGGTTLVTNPVSNSGYDTPSADGTYTYTVRAADATYNWSAQSTGVPVTVTLVVTPAVPAAPTATLAASPSRTVTVSWTAVSGATSYTVYMDGAQQATGLTGTSTTIANVTDGSHTFTVSATNASGASAQSPASTALVVDRTPPPVPTNVTAVLRPAPSRVVDISADTVAGAATYYYSYSGPSTSNSGGGTGSVSNGRVNFTYTIPAVADGTWTFAMRSRDTDLNYSAYSSPGITVVVDRTAPAVPGAPTLTPEATGLLRTVTVSWVAVSGAASYEVFRNGVSVGTTASTSLNDTPTSDGTYLYTVRAADSTDNWSAQGPSSSISIDRTPPGSPTSITASQTTPSSRNVTVTWSGSGDSVNYRVYREDVLIQTTTNNSYVDTGVSTDGSYHYAVAAQDAAGNWSPISNSVTAVVLLVNPPATPAAPTATLGASPSRTVSVSWTAVSGATSYDVYANGSLLGNTTGTTYSDTNVLDGTYSYTIIAKNTGGSSAMSPGASVTVDRTPPATPTISALLADSPSRNVTLSWTLISDANTYQVYRDGVLYLGSVSGFGRTSYTVTGNTDGVHTYYITATDTVGNVSGASNTVSVTVDRTPPATPAAPTVTLAASPSRTVTVSWTAVASAISYMVYRNGGYAAMTSNTSVDVSNVADGSHTFTVFAADDQYNWSASSPGTVLVVDRTSPVATNAPTVTPVNGGSYAANASWTPISDAVSYNVYVDGSLVSNVASASTTLTLTEGSHTLTIAGIDAAGNTGSQSTGTSFVIDVTPPDVPQAPTVVQPSATSRQVRISWTPVSGAASYKVYRNGLPFVDTASNLIYDDSIATDSTKTYTVRSVDAAGNVSADSTLTSIDVLIIPAQPGGPTVTLANPPSRTVTVAWVLVSGATSYNILRDGVVVGTQSTSPFTEDMADGTYVYRVQAVNNAGASASSQSGSITVYRSVPGVPATPTASVSGRTITVDWNNVSGALSYDVYRNGVLVPGGSHTYTNVADGSYTFTVAARNNNGVSAQSEASNEVSIALNTPDAPEEAPTAVLASAPSRVVTLTWDAVSRALSYSVLRNGTVIASGLTATLYQDSPADGTYTYTVKATNDEGTSAAGPASNEIVVNRSVVTAPGAPTATLAAVPGRDITVTWDAVQDATSYNLKENGVVVGTGLTVTEVIVEDAPDGTYVYTVAATSTNGTSAYGPGSEALVVDRTAPDTVLGVYATADEALGVFNVTWEETDDATAYEVFRNGVSVATVNTIAFEDEHQGFGTFTYQVRAKDAVGNMSELSSPFELKVEEPTGTVLSTPLLNVTANELEVEVMWSEVEGALGYSVLRDDVEVYSGPGLRFVETLDAGTYIYNVAAVADEDNRSGYSPDFTITISDDPDLQAPTLVLQVAGQLAHLTWSAVAGATGYNLYQDGVRLDAAGTDHYVGIEEEGTYTWTVEAFRDEDPTELDNPEEVGPMSNTVTTTVNFPPAAPVLTYSLDGIDVTLDWDAVSDTDHFEIYRDAVMKAVVPATQTTYLDEDRPAGSYTYSVRAVDANNGTSPHSNVVFVTIIEDPDPDITPTAPPAQPTITIVNKTVTVSWTAVTDAVFYVLRRNGVPVHSGDELTYSETLNNGTYVYTVNTLDDAGNASTESPSATATLTDPVVPYQGLNIGRGRTSDPSFHLPALPVRPMRERDFNQYAPGTIEDEGAAPEEYTGWTGGTQYEQQQGGRRD